MVRRMSLWRCSRFQTNKAIAAIVKRSQPTLSASRPRLSSGRPIASLATSASSCSLCRRREHYLSDSGLFLGNALPAVLCVDMAGTIVEVAERITVGWSVNLNKSVITSPDLSS